MINFLIYLSNKFSSHPKLSPTLNWSNIIGRKAYVPIKIKRNILVAKGCAAEPIYLHSWHKQKFYNFFPLAHTHFHTLIYNLHHLHYLTHSLLTLSLSYFITFFLTHFLLSFLSFSHSYTLFLTHFLLFTHSFTHLITFTIFSLLTSYHSSLHHPHLLTSFFYTFLTFTCTLLSLLSFQYPHILNLLFSLYSLTPFLNDYHLLFFSHFLAYSFPIT